jgi:hypothetical protein
MVKVIGAGFGRTGTHSMKSALEQIGFGPCHHMVEVLSNPDQLAKWRRIADAGDGDWDDVLAGYNASIDWPSAFYWRQLASHCPQAKVLLTVRSPESWYKSFSSTILKGIGPESGPDTFGHKVIRNKIFGGRPEDRDVAIAAFNRNSAEVRAAIPADRLLVYEIGDGWEPLCGFLGVPVPETAFPSSNSTDEFLDYFRKKEAAGNS